jgi:hypothetical protein
MATSLVGAVSIRASLNTINEYHPAKQKEAEQVGAGDAEEAV